MIRAIPYLLAILVSSLWGDQTLAVSTLTFNQSSSSGFEEGEKNNVSLLSTGIRLSPKIEPMEGIKEPYAWCLAKDPQDNIYIGTGDPGSVYKLSPYGELVLIYKSSELYIQSLAVSSTGYVYAGTSPRGTIYKISPEREASVFCNLPDPYIWDLLFDAKGNLYAATGPKGIIYKVSEEGTASVFFASSQANILDLVLDKDGHLYACSEPDGIIYKIAPEGNTFVLYDAEENEVHCLAIDHQGNLYAGTAAGARPQIPIVPPPPPAVSLAPPPHPQEVGPPVPAERLQEEIIMPPLPREPRVKGAEKLPPRGLAVKAPNFIYKITPEGNVRRILEVPQGFVFALSTDEEDNIFVGTGNVARLYKIDKEGEVSELLEVQESQILSLLPLGSRGLFFSTGNKGGLFRLSKDYTPEGIFESETLDARFNSHWGNISWETKVPEDTKITLATRTGNSKTPDNTWSQWSEEYTQGTKILSPSARFIQYRISLSSSRAETTPLLERVSIAYLPKNQAPEIISLEVNGEEKALKERHLRIGHTRPPGESPPREEGAPRGVPPTTPRQPGVQGTKHIQWRATDPNGDSLNFDLYYKGVGERNWKPLEKDIKKDVYPWQTARVPDGKYVVRLVASDKPDNPPDVALETDKPSEPFIIDNTRPIVTRLSSSVISSNEVEVNGVAQDELSQISNVQYSIDAEEWVAIFPQDMIFDSKEESFRFTVKGLSPQEHTIIIDATDAEGNIGSGKVLIDLAK